MFSKDKVQSLTECMRQMILLLMMDGFLNPAMLCLEMKQYCTGSALTHKKTETSLFAARITQQLYAVTFLQTIDILIEIDQKMKSGACRSFFWIMFDGQELCIRGLDGNKNCKAVERVGGTTEL